MRISDWSSDVCSSDLFWPKDFDYAGKKVVVIGSGATAVTIVPSMTEKGDGKGAAHVTMLQRTPTWYFIRPAKDAFANVLRKILPEKLAYRITRFKNVRLQDIGFRRAREKPEKDRKSVGQGKGVAGRVDLGDRRILPKKNKKKT